MSQKIRSTIGYWFFLLAGIGLMGYQVYKYVTNQLEPEMLEGIVFFAGILLIMYPKSLAEFMLRIARRKGGIEDES